METEKILIKACKEKIPHMLSQVNHRNIYIWGAWKGGAITESILKNNGITVQGFVDKRADELQDYLGYEVKRIDDMRPDKDYLIISLRGIDYTVLEILKKKKYTSRDCFYLYANETYNKEDIIYKGCRIGRYTYGYEDLLEYYPLADSIGRYCSINNTAKIWNNHPMEYVTTHPFLDHPGFYEWEKNDERQALIHQYGCHKKNACFENSQIRKNEPVIIGNDVWIGANVIILPGISIGDGAVLAAGAVITKDVDPYAVVGGVPAKLIKYRFEKDMVEQFLKIKWWDWSMEEIEKNIGLFYQPERFIETWRLTE